MRVAWMIVGCVASWLLASAVTGRGWALDMGVGMAGPLVAAAGSWMMIERTFRKDPARVTAVMYQSLAMKMLFFGAFVVGGVRGLNLHPVPFVVSLASYFITLHVIEAMWLRRLFQSALPAGR